MSNETVIVRGNTLSFRGRSYACAIGKNGFSADKKEGDGCSPVGTFSMRECWYRMDRIDTPHTRLPLKPIRPEDGWCDDPASTEYNRHILLPLPQGEGRGEGPTSPELIERARELRQSSTTPEQKLWALVRNRQLQGYKFRRQHPVPPYIADFCCEEIKLIIELDGESHATIEGMAKDTGRTAYLNQQGYKLIRFTNNEMMANPEGVYEALTLTLTLSQRERELHDLKPSPSGRGLGEGTCRHEKLFREDHQYDIVVPLGYNDAPVIAGKGSAIFLHVAKPDYSGTEGCIALSLPDLLEILHHCDASTKIEICHARA